jgi:gamma-glutamyltranspeptidase/glutathione hydrolase
MWWPAMPDAMAWRRGSELQAVWATWLSRGARAFAAAGVCCVAVAWAQSPATTNTAINAAPLQPEASTGFIAKTDVVGRKRIAVTAHPLATEAAMEILRAGGSAVDATVAAQMVLGLVEPQSSGIGGGAFMLFYDPTRSSQRLVTYDGRETAPQAAREDLFLKDGQPMAFADVVAGGRAVGAPGVLRLLAQAHLRHGKLPWARLFMPAVRLAEKGFPVSPRLHALLQADPYLRLDPAAKRYFYDNDGAAHPVGHILRNQALARVYRRIAQEGANAFYRGDLAKEIVRKVRTHPTNPGALGEQDLLDYRAVERAPLCFAHEVSETKPVRRYLVCGMAPPSSGTIAVGQILGLLERTPALGMRWGEHGPDGSWLHFYSEAARLAFADRAQYVADPDFLPVTSSFWNNLLQPDYLQQRARLMGPSVMPQVSPGVVSADTVWPFAAAPAQPEFGTSHMSIVDAQGRSVSMTTTIEDAFGARQMVQGFLLNNQLTDFSFVPRDASQRPIANRVQPGKRPRSSMSPLMVFDRDTGALVMNLGSPGGAMIIHYVTRSLWALMHEGRSAQQTVDGANFGNVNGPLVLEEKRFNASVIQQLKQTGREVREMPLTSGVQVLKRIQLEGEWVWQGGSDPRREGTVLGD